MDCKNVITLPLLIAIAFMAHKASALTLQQAILAADSYDSGIRAARELNDAEKQKRTAGLFWFAAPGQSEWRIFETGPA